MGANYTPNYSPTLQTLGLMFILTIRNYSPIARPKLGWVRKKCKKSRKNGKKINKLHINK
jgi:hypothetical protein